MAGAGGVPAALSGAEEAAPREGAGLLVAPGAELDKARGDGERTPKPSERLPRPEIIRHGCVRSVLSARSEPGAYQLWSERW